VRIPQVRHRTRRCAYRIKAVQFGQAQIHHDDIGPKAPALLDGVAPRRRFAAHHPSLVAFEERPHASPHDGVIVDDQDAQRHQSASGTNRNRARMVVP
jgi:hypothetical protein